MRRSLTGGIAFLAFTTSFLVPPAHAAPPFRPVETSTESIPMGSLDLPAVGALVRPGTGVQAAGMPQAPPTLSVMRAGTQKFSLVGVTWADDRSVTDTKVRVRTQSAGGTWGEWTEFDTDEAGAEIDDVPRTVRGKDDRARRRRHRIKR